MTWGSDPELERRASNQNSDYLDRSKAQHDLDRRRQEAEWQHNDAMAQKERGYSQASGQLRGVRVVAPLVALFIWGMFFTAPEAFIRQNLAIVRTLDLSQPLQVWFGSTILLSVMLLVTWLVFRHALPRFLSRRLPFQRNMLPLVAGMIVVSGIVSALIAA
jgi:hypothetical protein